VLDEVSIGTVPEVIFIYATTINRVMIPEPRTPSWSPLEKKMKPWE
jgi:hypothetical protein